MKDLLKLSIGKEKYPALTGIRAAGASIVFFDHFPINPNSHIIINVMAFFYVLSGFLITRVYYDQTRINRSWLVGYFTNRYARIYPVYFLLLTIAVFIRHDFHPWLLLKNYTLIHALFNNTTDFIIQPSWSLTVEECFYFLAPIIIVIIKRYQFMTALGFGALLCLLALAVSALNVGFLGSPQFVFSTTFFGHFIEFYAGVFLALIILKEEKKQSLPLNSIKYTVSGFLGILVLILSMIVIYQHPPLNHSAIILINNFLIPFPIALFYYGLIKEKTIVSALLSGSFSGLLGRASYSFYLLHTIIINFISVPYLQMHPEIFTYRSLFVIITFIITYLVSIVIFLFYEEPLNLFIRNRFRQSNRQIGMKSTLFNNS